LLNTDGANTWRAHNVTYENFFFVGADDVIAFKPNSTMITIKNVTSYGTTGLSFGSIGQYPGVVSSSTVKADARPISSKISGSRMSSSTALIRYKGLEVSR
jgi:hypothetical protein